MGPRQIS